MRPIALLVLAAFACSEPPPPPKAAIPTPPLHTPRWAFSPWISKDISDAADTRAFVAGFRERDIPVGVVVLDSPWETNYNTFEPSPARYPDFPGLVRELREGGVRVVLWTTQMINEESFDLEPGGDTYPGSSPNFAEATERGYCVNGGEKYFWWKGFGCAFDFFHPAALDWWHAQQDVVLDAGISGWKLDFGEEYVTTKPLRTAAGEVPLQRYSEEYYRDFLAYGVHRRGADEFVTMVRPYDQSYGMPGRFFARPEHAPVAWVGDNRRDWPGLADALDHVFRSARAGYAVVGSDIGGYLDRDDVKLTETIPFDVEVFQRWTAVGALTPFMQLHGRANITPWTVPERVEETVAAYRYWSWLHEELVPFFFSLAKEAAPKGRAILEPVGDESQWEGDYRFVVGGAFLVAPILDATGRRDVALPAGARWYDWWRAEADALEGGQVLEGVEPGAARVPLYVREGAIVPMNVSRDATGLGSAASKGHLTLLAYPSVSPTRFVVHDEDGKTTWIETSRSGESTVVSLSRAAKPVLLRARLEHAVARVTADGTALPTLASRAEFDGAASGAFVEASSKFVWVKLAASGGGRRIAIEAR